MAASVVAKSVVANPLSRTGFTSSAFPSTNLPSLKRNRKVQVRCKAEDVNKNDITREAPPTSTKGAIEEQLQLSKLTPPPSKKVSPKFMEVLSFTGPAPERINGRLAMIGFVSAIAVELTRGQDLYTQITNGGDMWFFWTSILFTAASLIPFSKGFGPGFVRDRFWNPDAEVWNGRAAMVGLIALGITEFLKRGPLV